MLVKCIKLQDSRINRLAGCEVKDHLTLGKEYVVLAISEDDWFHDDLGPSVLLCDDLSEDIPGKFPYFIPMFYFEIVDNTPSKYWITKGAITAFAPFVENRYFYFDLSEDDQKSQEAYMKYRKLLYEEAGYNDV